MCVLIINKYHIYKIFSTKNYFQPKKWILIFILNIIFLKNYFLIIIKIINLNIIKLSV